MGFEFLTVNVEDVEEAARIVKTMILADPCPSEPCLLLLIMNLAGFIP